MIYFGASLMLAAALPLTGVLYQLHYNLIRAYHTRLWADPLAPPSTSIERRHLTRPCTECSFIASTRTAYSAPVDNVPARVED
jgi:hypothetical protein